MVRKEELAHAAVVCGGREAGGGARTIRLRCIAGLGRSRRIAPAALLALAALAAQPTLSYADYPGHSNESRATAYGPLALNTPYRAGLQTENDTDYYYFLASAAHQQIHVSITNTASAGAASSDERFWLEANRLGELTWGAVRGDETEKLDYSVPSSGKYYLGFEFGERPQQLPGDYSFTISSSQPLLRTQPKPLTRAQKLANALKQCKKLKRTSKRRSCERAARQHYGPKR
jgi:hypothetical protein